MAKRVLSSILCVVMLFVLISVSLEASAALITTPASITNVSYKYNERVKFIDLSHVTATGDALKIPGSRFSAGDVIVDEIGQKSLMCTLIPQNLHLLVNEKFPL